MNIYNKRRIKLLDLIQEKYKTEGLIVLFADFEKKGQVFLQESNFYYLSGINEPGVVLTIDCNAQTELYIANTNGLRSKWMSDALTIDMSSKLNVDSIKYLGDPILGYESSLFIVEQNYLNLIAIILQVIRSGKKVFTVSKHKLEQTFVWKQFVEFIPGLQDSLVDISDLIAVLRRIKTDEELDLLCQAVDITGMAQEAAAQSIEPGALECEVQASVEFVMTAAGGSVAFPSIVGSGRNSVVLHYYQNRAVLQKGDVVVVDIGARYKHYCADITRTYPVNGKFTKRQREIYEIVLKTQEYIAEQAQPGMWLVNKEDPAKSLTHLAREFMLQRGGYDKYFIHGIGHFLGLDVHDAGNHNMPLQDGDVITIEPGVYISEENLGIRIEDNYLITSKGAICLSDQILKQVDEIEKLVSTRAE